MLCEPLVLPGPRNAGYVGRVAGRPCIWLCSIAITLPISVYPMHQLGRTALQGVQLRFHIVYRDRLACPCFISSACIIPPHLISWVIPGASSPHLISCVMPGASSPHLISCVIPGASSPHLISCVIPGASSPHLISCVIPGASLPHLISLYNTRDILTSSH